MRSPKVPLPACSRTPLSRPVLKAVNKAAGDLVMSTRNRPASWRPCRKTRRLRRSAASWGTLAPISPSAWEPTPLGRQAFVKALQIGARASGAKGATTLGRIVARSKDFAGSTSPTVKPGLERVVEALGGAAGEGAFMGAREVALNGLLDENGELRPEVGQQAAVGAALTLGFEGGLTLAGRALLRRAKPIDPGKALEGFVAKGAGRDVLKGTIRAEAKAARRQFKLLNKVMRVDEVEGGLYDAVINTPDDFERLIASQATRGLISKTAADRAIKASRGIRKADVNIQAARRIIDEPALVNFTSMGPADLTANRKTLDEPVGGVPTQPGGPDRPPRPHVCQGHVGAQAS